MFELHPDALLVNLSLLAAAMFATYDNKSNRSFPHTYKTNPLGQLLGLAIFIAVIYIEFRNVTWYWAIIDLVLNFIIVSILSLSISRFLDRKIMFATALIAMIISVFFLFFNIF